jgi:dipeptide/tripeptide permease
MNRLKKLTVILLMAIALPVGRSEASAGAIFVLSIASGVGFTFGAIAGTVLIGVPSYLMTKMWYSQKADTSDTRKLRSSKHKRNRIRCAQLQEVELPKMIPVLAQ